jgi:hypothetical protein
MKMKKIKRDNNRREREFTIKIILVKRFISSSEFTLSQAGEEFYLFLW